MVGTLDFQVKTLVFETWLGQCVVFLGKALYSHCAPLPPPPRSMEYRKYWLDGLGRGGSDNMPP